MKLLLVLVACSAYAQTVTAVKLAEVGHATAQLVFRSSDPSATRWLRMRVSTADCRDGTSGYAQRTSWEDIDGGGSFPDAGPYPGWSYAQVGGLKENTNYSVCPEISSNGRTWSRGQGVTLTTSALPAMHPEAPRPPRAFDSELPDTSGYVVKTYANGAECAAHLKADIEAAYRELGVHGTVLKLPHYAGDESNVCQVQMKILVAPDQQPADVHRFVASDVNTTTNQLHLAAHGLRENDTIKIGAYEACLPNARYSPGDCHSPNNQAYGAWGICQGCLYRVHVVDADHVAIYHPAGHLVTFDGGAGNGTGNCSAQSPCYWMAWPRKLHSIVVCTDASSCGNGLESTFIPTGLRLQGAARRPPTTVAPVPWQPASPSEWWADQLAVIEQPLTYSGHTGDWFILNDNGDGINRYSFLSHVYFTGIHFRYAPDPEQLANLTPWPLPKHQMVWSTPADDHWVFDRSWFDAGSSETHHAKIGRVFLWDGSAMSIRDSWLDGMHYYHVASSTLAQDGRYMGGACNGACGIEYSASDAAGYSIGAEGSRLCGGDTCAQLTAPAVVRAAGAANGNDWAYFTMDGVLNIALPPGLAGTCTGETKCRAYGLSTTGGSVYAGSDVFPTLSGAGSLYFVDPVWSPTGSSADARSPFGSGQTEPAALHPELATQLGWDGNPYAIGNHFRSDTSGFVRGIRFYKSPLDHLTTHTLTLWTGAGHSLATAVTANETATGWQEADFAAPVAVTAGADYVASYFSSAGVFRILSGTRNHEIFNAPLHIPGFYAPSTGSHDVHDNWPLDYRGTVAVLPNSGMLWSGGQPSGGWLAYVEFDGGGGTTSTEGSQCMVGGIGPGPYEFKNNFLEGSGTCWHHDDSGGATYPRAGYDYERNYMLTPGWALAGHPENDGHRYYHRHIPEWKSGDNGIWRGNVLAGAWQEDTPIGDLGEWTTATIGSGIRDWLFESNVWAHGGFAFSGPYEHPGRGPYAPYVTRIRFDNNLIWDISEKYCAHGFGGFCTSGNQAGGVIWDINDSLEDWVAAHNTIVYPSGSQPALLSIRSGQHELFLENNFLHINTGSFRPGGGLRFVNGAVNDRGQPCEAMPAGRTAFDCVSPYGAWRHNVLTSDGYTQTQLQTQWPSSFVPPNPDIGSSIGWYSFVSADVFNRYALKANWMSGSMDHATDGADVGVDAIRLRAALGYVELGSVLKVTASSAEVTFTDYAGDTCKAVDVSTDAKFPLGHYQRFWIHAPDSVEITGLAAHTTYQFRLLCQTMALAGQFQTQ